MTAPKPTTVIELHPEDTTTILSQREALKYLKAGLSSSLAYELFAFIPLISVPEKNVPFILKYLIIRLADFFVL